MNDNPFNNKYSFRNDIPGYFNAELSLRDFKKLSEFITTEFGVKMPPVKKVMLQSRLQKRLKALNIKSFKEYTQFLFSKEGMQRELIHMVDAITTNKTDFFREPSHFDFLKNEFLPTFSQKTFRRTLKVWSAGCSSGEEVYTLGMILSEFSEKNHGFDYSVYGSDISTRILKQAKSAVYDIKKTVFIPANYKLKYFEKIPNDKNNLRIVNKLQQKSFFTRINFMSNSYNIGYDFDIVFCRNVLIYFEREVQEAVIQKLCKHLKPGGIFFLGHSESIMNMKVPLKQLQPTIFTKI